MAKSPAAVSDLIPPQLRARLNGIQLSARQAAGAQGFGLHQSQNRGAGLEFSQYRAYEPGDELRQVDWKLYARSDRFFVRESERDSPLDLWILIDTSASMSQEDQTRPGWSRLDAARTLAACLLEIAVRQGDRFGLAMIGGDRLRISGLGAGARHRDRCLLQLHDLTAAGVWPDEARLRPAWEYVRPRSLVVFLGDTFEEEVVRLAERFAAARREVLNLQILTTEERDFPFLGGQRFRDPESGEELIADGAAVRDGFMARFAAARSALAKRLAASGIRHVEYVLDEPLDLPLRRLFSAGPVA